MSGLTQHGFEVKEKTILLMKFGMTECAWNNLCEELGYDPVETENVYLKILPDECRARDKNMRRLA